jgi:hypothetical protein
MEELQALVSSLQISLELQQRENQVLREDLSALRNKLAHCAAPAGFSATLPSPCNTRSRLNEMRDSLKFSRHSTPTNSLPGTPRASPQATASLKGTGLISRLQLNIPAKENAFFPVSFSARSFKTSTPSKTQPLMRDETKNIDRLMERRGYLRRFEKIGPGSYRFGNRRVFVTVRNDRLMVRDGNAFVHIDEFVGHM